MRAIADKMQELARRKEEEERQRQAAARDSDTLSTIVMPAPPADQLNRQRPDSQRQVGTRTRVQAGTRSGGDESRVGGREGQLGGWSAEGQRTSGCDDDDDDSSEEEEEEESLDNNNTGRRHVVARTSTHSLHSTLTPDDSQTDSSLALQKQLHNELLITAADNTTRRSIVSRATVI